MERLCELHSSSLSKVKEHDSIQNKEDHTCNALRNGIKVAIPKSVDRITTLPDGQ